MAQRASLMTPRMEELLERVDSKFTLVTLSAMRAREINDYYNQLGEGLGKIVPPQVTSVSRKPLSIAMEEIEVGKIEWVPLPSEEELAATAALAEAEAAAAREALADTPDEDGLALSAVRGSRIVLGVSGGIAAYKAVEICRRLVDAGAHVVAGAHRRTRCASSARSRSPRWRRNPPARRCSTRPNPIPHTRLGQGADLVIVAPATAKLLGKYAAGISDDLLTATLLATRAPVLVAPAMHTEMWEHPAVQDNLATLRRRGVHVVDPDVRSPRRR